MTSVRERSTAYLTVTFKDRDGAAAAPQSATYRIDDVRSGQAVRAETAISPIGATVTITLTATDNAILDPKNSREPRRVIVAAIYGTDDEVRERFDYIVVALEES